MYACVIDTIFTPNSFRISLAEFSMLPLGIFAKLLKTFSLYHFIKAYSLLTSIRGFNTDSKTVIE